MFTFRMYEKTVKFQRKIESLDEIPAVELAQIVLKCKFTRVFSMSGVSHMIKSHEFVT